MTNKEWLMEMTDELLACYLLRAHYGHTKDTDIYFEQYICPDGEVFSCIRAALDHTTEWLSQHHATEGLSQPHMAE